MKFAIILFLIITFVAVFFQSSRDNELLKVAVQEIDELHVPGPAFAREGFIGTQGRGIPQQTITDPNAPNPDGTGESKRIGPADANLQENEPYTLLNDTARPIVDGKITETDSESCYKSNYQSAIELVGNMAQRTNNYRHKYPDTCAGTRQEFVLGFYKPQSLY